MSGIPKLQNHLDDLSPFSPGKAGFWVMLTFLMVFAGWSVVGQNPVYSHDPSNSRNLDFFSLTVADAFNSQAKINRLIIAVDVNPAGDRFVLTFGNGIKRVGDTDGLIDFIPNQNDRLSNSLDFAINSEGKIFVATNESNRRFIRVYSPTGIYLPDETLGDGTYGNGSNQFRGPTGLAFDKDDNLYVADHYIGTANPPPTNPSFIKIYRKDALGNYKNNLITEFDNIQGTLLNFPYRLAVNSQGHLYMSELGQDGTPQVKILELDAGFNPKLIDVISGAPSQIGSPGSIIIDKFDNIFIADLGELDLPRLLAATNNVNEFYDIFEIIKSGIKNNLFNINVYNPNNSFNNKISAQIDFPVDLSISPCGTLYVNNAIFDGTIISTIFGRIPDITIDFDLEAYQRSPGYDTEKPVVTCPADILKDADLGKNYSVVSYSNPTFSDNCSTPTLTQTGLVSGSQFPIGINDITFTATDSAGNTTTCSFTITIMPGEEVNMPPVFVNCPANINENNDAGSCGAKVTFQTPLATDDNNNVTVTRIDNGPQSGDLFPVGITTINFEANDGVNAPVSCSFTITVIDNENPTITCPSNITETIAIGQTGKIVSYTLPVFNDSCSGPSILQTAGFASGSNFPLGTTTNTFVVTDASGNTADCSFTITITEVPDTEVPVITCPADITKNVDSGICGATVNYTTPAATDNSGSATVSLKSGPSSGSLFSVGITTVTFEATDEAGNIADCSFIVTVIDNENPTITCPSTQTENYDPAIGFTLPDYTGLGITNDNCGLANVTQSPAIGTLVTVNTQITLTVTDSANNSSTCAFMVNLSINEVLKIDCPSDQEGQLNENCQFTIPDYSGLATVNFGNANITQVPIPGTIVNSESTIKLTATLNGQTDDCSFQLILEDSIAPEANCVGEYSLSLNAEGIANLAAAEINFNSTDHCGIASTVIDKTLFTFNDLGENIVTLTVTDTAGNVDSCNTTVKVLIGNYVPGNFECKSPVVIQLDETGNATISSGDLYTGDPGDRIFALSKSSFNCSNIGNNQVDLSYTGNDGSGTCGINVIVEDRISPEVQAKNINVNLDSFGNAIITPEMIDNGSTDNCGIPQLSLDVSNFSCNDLGENTVILKATDDSGNFTTQMARVTVLGSCIQIPETGFEYIFIYPNPTPGPFTFDTPTGWSIEKVEVYDARGRYVLTETYSENQIEYSMDLSSLQQAVYILKLYTSQGIKIIRVIIY